MIGASIATLQGWRYRGRGPKFVKISRKMVRYRRGDVDAWISAHLATSTATPPAGDGPATPAR
jgi:predicted DNA-binding transcriptional regulator AlpA